jgi:hypothetical protein
VEETEPQPEPVDGAESIRNPQSAIANSP